MKNQAIENYVNQLTNDSVKRFIDRFVDKFCPSDELNTFTSKKIKEFNAEALNNFKIVKASLSELDFKTFLQEVEKKFIDKVTEAKAREILIQYLKYEDNLLNFIRNTNLATLKTVERFIKDYAKEEDKGKLRVTKGGVYDTKSGVSIMEFTRQTIEY
jgi:indole-3-glycerol phosphate synthase